MQPARVPAGQNGVNQRQNNFDNDEQFKHQQNQDHTCYESCLLCGGSFFGFFRAWFPCFCCCCPTPFQIVETSSVGLLESFGRFQQTLEPGLHQINPWTDSIRRVTLKTLVGDLKRQVVITKDNLTVDIDTVVYYRVIDPRKALYNVQNFMLSVEQQTYTALRTVIGEHVLQDLLEKRQLVSDEIETLLEREVASWGVYVDNVFIKDMILKPETQNDMAAAAKQKRIGESKVISAKADVESAKLLKEAADILDSKAAMQIRYFETIQQIAKGQGPKVMFLPLQGSSKR